MAFTAYETGSAETSALTAVLDENKAGAREILCEMTPRERARLSDALEDLDSLIGELAVLEGTWWRRCGGERVCRRD